MKRLLFILALVCSWAGIARAQVPVALAPSMHPQFLDSAGKVLSNGLIYTYSAGTTVRLDTYTDSSGAIINAWPIPLDATGSPSNLSTQTGIWLSNNTYKICAYSSAMVQAWCTDNVSAYQILNGVQNITFGSVTSDPTGAAGMLGYRSDIPCFRFFASFWDCGVTYTGIQTLTNKTLTSPILNTPTVNTPTIATPIVNGATTGTGVQGTDSKLLSSGTVSGVLAAPLCLDALGGATTTGCGATNGAVAGCTAIGPATVVNNNAAQNLLSCTIAANALSAGSLIAVDLTGIESTASGQSIQFTVNLGGGTVCSSFSPTFGVANNQPIYFWAKFATLTTGAGGTGNWTCGFSSVGNSLTVGANGTVGAPTISINTTVSNVILVQVQMSVANAGNSVVGQLLKSVIF